MCLQLVSYCMQGTSILSDIEMLILTDSLNSLALWLHCLFAFVLSL